MSKQGMARPEWTHTQPRNTAPPVPELQGKAKHGKAHANPVLEGAEGSQLKVWPRLKVDGSSVQSNP